MSSSPQGSFSTWLWARLRVKSIRGQLTLGLAATLGPCLILGFFLTREYVRSRVYRLTESRLQAEAELISYGLNQWGQGVADAVETLTVTSPFIDNDIGSIHRTFLALTADHPSRLWRFWSASTAPRLLAYSGLISKQNIASAQANQYSRDYYQAALRGFSTYQVVASKTSGRACLNVSQPVFKTATAGQQDMKDVGSLMSGSNLMSIPARSDISGVIVLCLPLSSLGKETGLLDLFDDSRLALLSRDNNRDFLYDKDGFESAVILISNSGQLLFPDVDWGSMSIPNIADLAKTTVPSLLPIAQRAQRGEEFFTTLTGENENHRYLALTSRVDSAWSLILLLNERSATADVTAIGRVQLIVAFLTLFFLLLIIAYRSRSLSRPVTVAGLALEKISTGNFDVQLPIAADDEMGGLLRNVQLTADRLKCYLREVTSFAVTEKQIDTAKSIQKDFLLAQLPSSIHYDVAAFSRPALQIGADWYDMVDTGEYAIFIVADVCDKGVPSALYMSVFRSLIRSKLLAGSSTADLEADPASLIRAAIEQTNSYMASNQNDSMMFATVFISAVHKLSGAVSFVCAGHESPVVVSPRSLTLLDSVSGPAIGLFPDVTYSASSFQLDPGDALVVYSDGLVDARDPADHGWGIDRLRALLGVTRVNSAQQLLTAIISTVDDYMDGNEQFDDLTVMVFRWLGPNPEG
jgi:serine phosphatase RsbU (regulator of sigma subunit)